MLAEGGVADGDGGATIPVGCKPGPAPDVDAVGKGGTEVSGSTTVQPASSPATANSVITVLVCKELPLSWHHVMDMLRSITIS